MNDSKPTAKSREQELFIQALEHPSPPERAAFLAAAWGEDLALMERVEARKKPTAKDKDRKA
ncbi:MAG TPA: hypothetical protein VN829_22620 [Dongiaceae bacterium]|nr:hypothetical protein [Dongiaceae bacterium]